MENNNYDINLTGIILKYGINNQLKHLHEELYELTEALFDYKLEHIKEELSDCYVILDSIKLIFNFKDEELDEIKNNKVNREIERIKNNEKQ